jgi:hypothetical protein
MTSPYGIIPVSLSARVLPLGFVVFLSMTVQTAHAQTVTLSTVAANGYGTGDINSCAIAFNNLTTLGSHQFIGFYDSGRNLRIGRRDIGSPTWQTYNTGITLTAGEIADDHNVIALAVDTNGRMHLSWNMHNQPLNYSISNAVVTGATLPGGSIAFTRQTAANAPTLFPGGGSTTGSVTYPVFAPVPGSDSLLFTYRNGSTGGGSGNGNQFFNVYNPSTNTWTNRLVINGVQSGVNAYLNSPVFDSSGNLLASWTWRASPNWQSNSNILFAQSPDAGTTWFRQGGTTQYGLPIIQSGTPASAVAQVIKTIPQNNSLINQTSMTVDRNDNPVIATWYAPNAASGNHNRQYMLVYYTGTEWLTSQITNRTSDTGIDTSAFAVRDLARPIVLVDDDNRVLVVTRFHNSAMGSYGNPATPGNNIVVYWTEKATLDTGTATWNSIVLDTTNMGAWEPTYDSALWASHNRLALLFEPVGLTGQTTGVVKVLEWDVRAHFNPVPESSFPFVTTTAGGLLVWLIVRLIVARRAVPVPSRSSRTHNGQGFGSRDKSFFGAATNCRPHPRQRKLADPGPVVPFPHQIG